MPTYRHETAPEVTFQQHTPCSISSNPFEIKDLHKQDSWGPIWLRACYRIGGVDYQPMLRVTESEQGGSYVLMVEGKLTGATLGPLSELLQRLPAAFGGAKPVLVDLIGVTSIDAEGKQIL